MNEGEKDDPRLAVLLAAFHKHAALFGGMSIETLDLMQKNARLFLIFWDALRDPDRIEPKLFDIPMAVDRTDDGIWLSVASCPLNTWVRTRREGEVGENECYARPEHVAADGFPTGVDGLATNRVGVLNVEWVDREGRTTVTHHSFAAPTHWRPL